MLYIFSPNEAFITTILTRAGAIGGTLMKSGALESAAGAACEKIPVPLNCPGTIQAFKDLVKSALRKKGFRKFEAKSKHGKPKKSWNRGGKKKMTKISWQNLEKSRMRNKPKSSPQKPSEPTV